MTRELLGLALTLAALYALLKLSMYLYLGFRFHRMCGGYLSAVAVIEAHDEQQREAQQREAARAQAYDDNVMRPAFRAAEKYFPGRFL